MDAPDVDVRELTRSLVDLRQVNRWIGGTRVALHDLRRMVRAAGRFGAEIRVLDVGTGSADIPMALAVWARRAGMRLRVVATDPHPATLSVARGRTADDPDVTVEHADARSLPYADGAFHFAMCHTALHHLEGADAVKALRELNRVARDGVVVTDLIRSRTGLVGVRLLGATLWRSHPITRHDGNVSIRAAFTPAELREMAREAGLAGARVRRHLLANRMALVVDRTAPARATP